MSLLTTGLLFQQSRSDADHAAQREFDRTASEIRTHLLSTFAEYATQLEVARGFVAATEEVSRGSWRSFVEQSGIRERSPGIFGFAYVDRVRHEDLEDYVAARRAEGFGDLRVRPVPKPDMISYDGPHYVIRYHEPEEENRSAIGLDLATRSTNKDVYDRAASTGSVQLSSGIPLVQEEADALGLVMAVPITRSHPGKASSFHAFDTDLHGWIAMPIGLSRLIRSSNVYEAESVRVRLWEGQSPYRLLYSSSEWSDKLDGAASRKIKACFGGVDLYVQVSPVSGVVTASSFADAYTVLFAGLLATLVFGGVVHWLSARRDNVASKMHTATHNAKIGVWEWDLIRNRFSFSDSYFEMLGYAPGELSITEKSWEEICHPEDLVGERDAIRRYLSGETDHYENEHRVRTKSGGWLWVRDTGQIVRRTSSGKPSRMLGVHIDIQSLRDAQTAAESAKRRQADFFANMSHEIRTPLTAIMGFADLMDTDDSVQRSDAANTVRRNARVLLSLVDDLLDVSKLQAAKLRVESIAIDPWEIVQEVIELLAPRAEGKEVRVASFADGLLPRTIQSDPTRFRQILFNLVGNAIKFTESGSVDIILKCSEAASELQVAVRDTGVGMNSAQVAELKRFEGFFQADASTSRLFGGTGLGLQIVNELTRLLGGGLAVESEPGVGSTFSATVSVGNLRGVDWHSGTSAGQSTAMLLGTSADSSTTSASGHPPEPVKQLAGMRILVVEDGLDNQRLVRHHLDRAGASVHIAENGQKALDWMGSGNKPDLVLMDIQMPVMDGYAATRKLRADGVETPIVALTANAGSNDRRECFEAGTDDVITKPIDVALLLETCAKWRGRERPRQVA
ncbi:MAG: CHASE domain-containing protein [Planctomycetota bacterium]